MNCRHRVRIWLPLLALMLLSFILQAAGDGVRLALRYERLAVAEGQWWRLISAHLVHLGWYHYALNMAGLLLWAVWQPQRCPVHVWMLRGVGTALAIGAGLFWMQPGEANYAGMSGLVHGLYVFALWPAATKGDRLAAVAGVLLVAKLVWEQWAGVPLSDEEAIGGHVVTSAHLYGALAASMMLGAEAIGARISSGSTEN